MPQETIVALTKGANSRSPAAERGAQDQPLANGALSGLASILVPCCGQLEYTKLCVPNLLKYTRQPFELIFLDIGSLDGTAEYLAGIAAAAQVRVEVVRTPTDLGISQAVQDALKLARGEYVVLVNNDTVVCQGWLHQLVEASKLSPAIGMVGPMSNYAAPPQLIEHVPYRIGPRKSGQGAGSSGQWAVGSQVAGVKEEGGWWMSVWWRSLPTGGVKTTKANGSRLSAWGAFAS